MTLKVDRKKVAKGALAGLLALMAAFLIALALLWPRCRAGVCPSVDSLLAYQPPQASEVLDRDGRLLARLAPEQRIVVPITSIPRKVAGAFLAVEDRRFYQHHGIDWRRVGGAFWRNVKSLRLREGSSTLTMQLSRNVFPDQIGPPHSLRRKLGELVLAREIEEKLPKDRILELYLNQIYLGNGLYGVEAAARGYFGKSVRDLTPAQAALLASLPKAPTSYDPRRFPDAAHKRRDLVLTLMAQEGYLTPAELKKAQREKIKLVPLEEPQGAPWFIAAVRRELHDRLGPRAASRDSFDDFAWRQHGRLPAGGSHLAAGRTAQPARGAARVVEPRCGGPRRARGSFRRHRGSAHPRPHHPHRRVPFDGARRRGRRAARAGSRLRRVRERRRPDRAALHRSRRERRGSGPVAGARHALGRAHARRRLHDDELALGRRRPRHRNGGAERGSCRPAFVREDRNDQRRAGRVVRRSDSGAGRSGLAWLLPAALARIVGVGRMPQRIGFRPGAAFVLT